MIEADHGRHRLEPGAAVELAHALVQRAADIAGVRALFIKGPVANHHRLREARTPSDVDVLVHPRDVETLTKHLAEWGWKPRPESFAHRSFVTHSITLVHPQWPCDIDVHRAFPGFLADDGVAFDHAWNWRETILIAATPVTGVDFAASAAIAALHALRAPYITRNRDEYDQAVKAVEAREDVAAQTAAIAQFAGEVGALWTIAPFLRDLGISVRNRPAITAKYVEWHRNSQQLNRAASWLMIIAGVPWPKRSVYIWRAVFPGVQDLLLDHPSTPHSLSGITRTWLERAVQAVRAMPAAVAVVREERRLLADDRGFTQGFGVLGPTPIGTAATPIAPLVPAESLSKKSPATWSAQSASTATAKSPDLKPAGTPATEAARRLTGVTRAEHVAEVSSAEGTVLLPLARPAQPLPYVIGGTGLTVWRITGEVRALEQIVGSTAQHFDVDPGLVRSDVEAFLIRLVELQVLLAR